MFRYAIFDLDETLYPTSNGLMQAISGRMRRYITERYGLIDADAHELQKRYWRMYGTTFRGLYVERHIEPEEYLRFVHDVPVKELVTPDPHLREVLLQIPEEKVILTNADAAHARRILDVLNVGDLFARIFDIVFLEYECKPTPSVYEHVLKDLNVAPQQCVYVEDAIRNLAPARALGMKGILVGEGRVPEDADAVIADIHEVAEAIRRLDV